jgi:hypothetical protein
MQKIDYKQKLSPFYKASTKEVVEVDVPAMNFLVLDGEGDPNHAPAYAEAVETLFTLAYTLKFMVKKAGEVDYGVMPLEGLWWADDMKDFGLKDKSDWKWTMMIMQPEVITRELVSRAMIDVQKKKNLPAIAKVRFESFTEGRCAQLMHIGPFSAEGPNIAKVHDFIEASGHALAGKHHEIYLSDIRRSDPSKWKTIIRQPMR